MAASMGSCQACRLCRTARALQHVSNTRLVHKYLSRCLSSKPSVATQQDEKIIIPKKIQKDDYAVLRALGNTVRKRFYKKTAVAGRQAAQYVLQKYPKLFLAYQHDEPKIKAFYPPLAEYSSEEPGEEAVLERVDAHDIDAAWEMYQALVEKDLKVSLKTCNALLDLLCFYGDQKPRSVVDEIDKSISTSMELQQAMKEMKEESSEAKDTLEEEVVESGDSESDKSDKSMLDKNADRDDQDMRYLPKWRQFQVTWIDGNKAEQLFESMQEKCSHSYNTMIQGMVKALNWRNPVTYLCTQKISQMLNRVKILLAKHHAHNKAFGMYNEMQQKGLQTDLKAYNALLNASIYVREESNDRWLIMLKLMQQMELEGIRPTLYTFNNIMTGLSRSRTVGRKYGMQVVNEMKALGIEPSLGTYLSLLRIYQDNRNPVVEANILHDIMDSIEGQDLTIRHPTDTHFFVNAMSVCLKCKDVELAYLVETLVNSGSNSILLGHEELQNVYYSRFFSLICQMESVDSMLEYYERLVPSIIVPNPEGYCNILQSMETAGAYDKISSIWHDAVSYSYKFDEMIVDTVLTVMAEATEIDMQVQKDFCDIATSITANINYIQTRPKRTMGHGRPRAKQLQWSSNKLNNMVAVYLKGQQLGKAWQTLEHFKKTNNMPSTMIMEDFLSACINAGDKQMAVGCVQVAMHFLVAGAATMAERIKEELILTPSERKHLDYIFQEEGKVNSVDDTWV